MVLGSLDRRVSVGVVVCLVFSVLLFGCQTHISPGELDVARGAEARVTCPGLANLPVQAKSIDDSLDGAPLGMFVEYQEDQGGTLDLHAVRSGPQSSSFKRVGKEVPGFGFSHSVYWFRFWTCNGIAPSRWLLEIAYPMLDDVQLFAPVEASYGLLAYRMTEVGDRRPFAERPIQHRNFVFELNEPPSGPHAYYLRVKTSSSVNVPMYAWTPKTFVEKDSTHQLVVGGILGVLIALTIYNFFLYFAIRDKTYILYVAAMVWIIGAFATLDGLSFQYLWPSSPWWANVGLPFIVAGGCGMTALFAYVFLDVRQTFSKARNAYHALLLVDVVTMLASFFLPYGLTIRAAAGAMGIGVILTICHGIVAARGGSRPALYYLFAWSAFLLGTGLYVLKSFGVLPNNALTSWGVQAGAAIQSVLLSFALADRINEIKRSKDAQIRVAQKQLEHAVDELKTSNVMLEDRVQERTKELVTAKDAAESANRTKSTFLANMSHEIRTPLNGVLGMVEVVLDTALTEGQKEHLRAIRSSAQSLLSLLNDILDLAKIEAGKLELNDAPFEVASVLDDAMDVCAVRAHGKGLELLGSVTPDVPAIVVGDGNRLRQVIVNLVGNAIKFTATGEVEISVSLESKDDASATLHFSVRDTGVGIPADRQDAVFKAFEQADGSTSRKYGGTGLGLAISTEFVHLMGGRIWLESEVGRGTVFHFTARFGAAEVDADAAPERRYSEAVGGIKVLIVDDNQKSLGIVSSMVTNWGMVPVPTASSDEAWSRLAEAKGRGESFDIALIDGAMPTRDGFSLVEQIRLSGGPVGTPVMMLTIDDWPAQVAKCTRLGIKGYLRKPVRQSDLLDTILVSLGVVTREAIQSLAVSENRSSIRPLRVLLAEDNPINQEVALHFLSKGGHSTVVANDGVEAVSAWKREPFDLILMDGQMPNLNGYEATGKIREQERRTGAHVPIIALTANAMKGDREACLVAGMDGYVTKPLTEDALYAEVRRVMAEHHPDVLRAKSVSPKSSPPTRSLRPGSRGMEEGPRSLDPLRDPGFDPNDALGLMGGSEDLLKKMMSMFLEDAAGRLGAIEEALREGDAKKLGDAAHTFKGMAMNFAAKPLADAALSLEMMGKAGELATARASLDMLRRLLFPVVATMERYIGQTGQAVSLEVCDSPPVRGSSRPEV